MSKTALVLLAPGFEEIEAVTSIDVLRRAEIDVTVAAVSDNLIVRGSRNVQVKADMLFKDVKADTDCVVLPGGVSGAETLADTKEVIELVKEYNRKNKIVAAICAAPACVLVSLGVVNGKEATCYPEFEDILSERAVFRDEKVVISDNIITSQGVGTAIEFALAIVDVLVGSERASMIRKAMVVR